MYPSRAFQTGEVEIQVIGMEYKGTSNTKNFEQLPGFKPRPFFETAFVLDEGLHLTVWAEK